MIADRRIQKLFYIFEISLIYDIRFWVVLSEQKRQDKSPVLTGCKCKASFFFHLCKNATIPTFPSLESHTFFSAQNENSRKAL